MKCRLIYDRCTPTADRRPTTIQDVEDDIHIEQFDKEEDLLDKLLDLAGYDEEDLEDYDLPENATVKDKIETILSYFEDPGDGSPNILYVSIDGQELDGDMPYDCISDIDLETCSRDELVSYIQNEFADEDYLDDDFDDDDEDYDDEEDW